MLRALIVSSALRLYVDGSVVLLSRTLFYNTQYRGSCILLLCLYFINLVI